MSTDTLRMDYINSLPQPFIATLLNGSRWPVYDFEVGTGLMRIDVCGQLDLLHICECKALEDAEGTIHDPDTFYTDSAQEPSA